MMTDSIKSKETKSQMKSAPRKESIKEIVDDEVRFANELAKRESELGSEFKKLESKFDEDEGKSIRAEDKLEDVEIETRELAHEFTALKEKERKAEEAKLQRLRRLEKEAMTLADELAQMQKEQKDRESDKIAQIVEHEKEARRIAAELVETYETDRKLAEEELQKIETAEKEARKTMKSLANQLGEQAYAALNEEKDLLNLEHTAKKRAAALADLVKAGKHELVALSTELNEHTQAIAAAGNEYKQAILRREAAERVLNDLKLDEKAAEIELNRVLQNEAEDRKEYHSLAQELANVQAEAVDAEYYVETGKHSHAVRAKEQGEAAETANQAFNNAKSVLEKLVKDKEAVSERFHELHTLELLARERVKDLEASCLTESHHPSVVNVFEHKRYEIDEKDVGVKHEDDEIPHRQGFLELMGKYPIFPAI